MVADIGSSVGAPYGEGRSRWILNLASRGRELQASKRGPNCGGPKCLSRLEQNIRSLDIVIDLDRWFVFVFKKRRVETDNLWSMYD